jgi:hypothetical protein
MKYSALLALIFCTHTMRSQSTFVVDDFSDRYFGKVFIADTNLVFSKGWIAIFDKRSKKQLLRVRSDELSFDLREGKIVSNVKELPYGEQSSIMYEDFNFDGRKDFGLMDGQNSCYHGPSFQIYLASRTGFVHSPAFTRLAQNYCGMFDVDHQKRRIRTMTKSGCCWHQNSEFIVRKNRPFAIKIVEEGLNPNGIAWDLVEKKMVGGKMRSRNYSVFDSEGQKENTVYSFEFSNRKIMRLLRLGDTLNYVFTDNENRVELIYSGTFHYSEAENVLSFKRGKATYKITSNGILVTTPKNHIEMKAGINARTGSFLKLQDPKYENVTYQ